MFMFCFFCYSCGIDVFGWLDDIYFIVVEDIVIRRVYFCRVLVCCKRFIEIEVKNCGFFYVYCFNGILNGRCNLWYCGID